MGWLDQGGLSSTGGCVFRKTNRPRGKLTERIEIHPFSIDHREYPATAKEAVMRRARRWVGALCVSLFFVVSYTHDAWSDKVYGRDGSCIPDGHGGPNNSGPLRAGSAPQSLQQCVPTREVYNSFPLPHLDQDIDLLLSGNFDATSYPYMDNSRINIYLRSMDADSSNEFHKPRRDFQLVWDYFHGKDSTRYYGTFGLGNPNLDFDYSNVPDAEENHVDIYLNHPNDGLGDQYPYQGPAEPQEDGNPALCDEYNLNTFSHGGGFKSTLGSCGWVSNPDPDWHLSGERASLVAQHEFQHVCFRGDSGPGFPNEAFSMAAEYLVGASVRDSHRPLVNTIYDRPLVNVLDSFNAHHYRNWYLWGIYLSQQFAGDTTRIEDDLIYKWVRNKNELGAMEQSMKGIARVLSGSEYAGLGGSTGADRLRNLYHNYVLAKWIDNPNPGFHGGRLGFSRGIDPSWTPGFFDNTFAPVGRNSAEVVPPRFLVGSERIASDLTYPIGAVYQVADTLR
jgi:hypothetical protein